MTESNEAELRSLKKPPSWRTIRIRVAKEILEGCRNGAAPRVHAIRTLLKAENLSPEDIGSSEHELTGYERDAADVIHNPINP